MSDNGKIGIRALGHFFFQLYLSLSVIIFLIFHIIVYHYN